MSSMCAAPTEATWTQGRMDRVMEESAKPAMLMIGAGVLEHFRVSSHEIRQHSQRCVDIGSVGHSDGEIQLSNRSEIVQNFSGDFAIGDHDPGVIWVHQGGCKDVDFSDIAVDPPRATQVRRLGRVW